MSANPLNVVGGIALNAAGRGLSAAGSTLSNGGSVEQAAAKGGLSAFASALEQAFGRDESTFTSTNGAQTSQSGTSEFSMSVPGIDLSSQDFAGFASLEDLIAHLLGSENPNGSEAIAGLAETALPSANGEANSANAQADALLRRVDSILDQLGPYLSGLTTELDGADQITSELQGKAAGALDALKALAALLNDAAASEDLNIPDELKATIDSFMAALAEGEGTDTLEQLRAAQSALGTLGQGIDDALAGDELGRGQLETVLRSQLQERNADLARRNGLNVGGQNTNDETLAASRGPDTALAARADAAASAPKIQFQLNGDGQLPFVTIPAAQGGAGGSSPFNPAAALQNAAQTAYTNNPVSLPHMAIAIARQVEAGVNRFQMRLDPPELGRIDVRMDMDKSTGVVNARLAVERVETLDLLVRDQRALERALTQAGLDPSKTNLEFSLNQGSQQNNMFADFAERGNQDLDSPADTPPPSVIENAYRAFVRPGGINVLA